jgi:hypothetical protein
MTWDHQQPPTPEQLTAYHDGELEPAARSAIDAWLIDHPETAADLAAWRRVDAAWKDSRPEAPHEDVWDEVRRRVDKGLAEAPRRPVWWLGLGAAAAILFVLGWALWPTKTPPTPFANNQVEDDEPFEIIPQGEVRIISMDGSGYVDIDGERVCSIVGAELPVPDDELCPTSFERTTVINWGTEIIHDEWDVPMIVDPAVLAAGWKP